MANAFIAPDTLTMINIEIFNKNKNKIMQSTKLNPVARHILMRSIVKQSGDDLRLTDREKVMVKWFFKFSFSIILASVMWAIPVYIWTTQLLDAKKPVINATILESKEKIESVVEIKPVEAKQVEPVAVDSGNGKVITATVTAYSEIDSCHTGVSCLMASGKRAYVGAIACPRNISFGTRVVIDNTTYTCEDRVSLKYPNRFDIFMGYGQDSYNKAISYGKKTKSITIH